MSPAIILVPGMSSVGSFVYAPLTEELKKANLEHVAAVDLPSVDCTTTKAQLKPNALEADIKRIRSVINLALIESQLDVVVVAHSYGGTPALYACEGLWKAAQPEGTPGVLSVALISSSLTLPGGSVAGDRAEFGKTHGGINDSDAKVQMVGEELVFFPESNLTSVWFNDMAEAEGKHWVDTLRPCSLGGVMSPAPPADVGLWKISYLVTTELDFAMPEAFQKHLAERAREAGAEVMTEEIKSGHFAQATHTLEVAEWIKSICQS